MKLVGALSFALAALLTLGTGQAATTRFLADVPLLALYPASTAPGHTGSTEADIYVTAGTQMAKIVIFIPTGYGNVLGRTVGSQAGRYDAFGPSNFSFGYLSVQDPSTFTNDPCAPGLHQSVWQTVPEVFEPGDLPPTPFYLDATTGSDTSLGAYKAQFCVPVANAPAIRELDFLFNKLANPPTPGVYSWHTFVTPYTSGVPDPTRTFEVRGTIPMPMTLTMHGRYDRRHHRAILTGRLTATGYGVSGVYLELGVGLRNVASTRVNAHGTFTIKRRIKKTTRFQIWTSNYTACADSTAPAGCPSDALANVSSRVVKVVVPKR